MWSAFVHWPTLPIKKSRNGLSGQQKKQTGLIRPLLAKIQHSEYAIMDCRLRERNWSICGQSFGSGKGLVENALQVFSIGHIANSCNQMEAAGGERESV